MKTAIVTLLVSAILPATTADWGCYNTTNNSCNCESAFCNMTQCNAAGGLWVAGCRSCGCICESSSRTFTVEVDLFAGPTGYYRVNECGDINPNPTLGMNVDVEYTFNQGHVSNWYHPMGFAYFADGALSQESQFYDEGAPELEEGVSQGTSNCDATETCPFPAYFANGNNVGLDGYEPTFFWPLDKWYKFGGSDGTAEPNFLVKVNFTDSTYTNDIFYFCHIHYAMTGRIKLLDSGNSPLNATNSPAIPYDYQYNFGRANKADTFDSLCGTFALEADIPGTTTENQCPSQFICDDTDSSLSTEVKSFAGCVNAMNCQMLKGMTTVAAETVSDNFVYQMVPHHLNAINMAKALLKTMDLNTTINLVKGIEGGDSE